MYISDHTLDDLLRRILSALLKTKNNLAASRGANSEFTGVLLQLTNPRARLSRSEGRGKLFSCIGELLWYLAATNDLKFIEYYVKKYAEDSDDGKTIYGGYGPRLFSMRKKHNQINNVLHLLTAKPTSRRAMIQLFDAQDIAGKERRIEIPCTATFQFLARNGKLDMIATMRSNDAFLGLPHDVFTFTMLQEIMARSIGCEVGTYKHFVGSLHLYDKHREKAQQYIDEGWQPTQNAAMPPMPKGDPWPAIGKVLKAESAIRAGRKISMAAVGLDPYWMDLIHLLRIYRCSKEKNPNKIKAIKRDMSTPLYESYISVRQTPKQSVPKTSQYLLPYAGKLSKRDGGAL